MKYLNKHTKKVEKYLTQEPNPSVAYFFLIQAAGTQQRLFVQTLAKGAFLDTKARLSNCQGTFDAQIQKHL